MDENETKFKNTLQKLLSTGICEYDENLDFHRIKLLMNTLNYELFILKYKKIAVLKDLSTLAPLNKEESLNVKDIFRKIAVQGKITNNEIVENNNENNRHIIRNNKISKSIDLLEKKGWIKKYNDDYEFTERALVQFDDYILSLEGVYKRCELCDFLTSKEIHDECKSILLKNQK